MFNWSHTRQDCCGAYEEPNFGAENMPSGDSMEAQDQGQDDHAGEVLEDVGVPAEESNESSGEAKAEGSQAQDPLYVQKRLKQQKRAHEREIRELHQRINDMQSREYAQPEQSHVSNPYTGQPTPGGVDEQIHKAVSYALQHRDMEERKAKEEEHKAHLHKQYSELDRHLDRTSDKYDDFDDVVRGDHANFTGHMRDASLFLPRTGAGSAGEVLYKLGKNPEELSRIAKLHPLDQAAEMVALSHALINGGENKSSQNRPLGNIKSNPVTNSPGVNEKTSVSELRKRMRNNWK
jgi:hypothetical protein